VNPSLLLFFETGLGFGPPEMMAQQEKSGKKQLFNYAGVLHVSMAPKWLWVMLCLGDTVVVTGIRMENALACCGDRGR